MHFVNFKLWISVNHCSNLHYQLFAHTPKKKKKEGSGENLLELCLRGPSAVVPSVVSEIRDKLCKQRYHKKRQAPFREGHTHNLDLG